MVNGTSVKSKAAPATKHPRKTVKKPQKPRQQATTAAVAPAPVETPIMAETAYEREIIKITRDSKAEYQATLTKQSELIGHRVAELAGRRSIEANAVVLGLLDRFLGHSSYAPPEKDPDYEPAEYFKLQIVLPLALSLVKNVIPAEDLYTDEYCLTNLMDWMMDAVPEMLNELDEVALIEYLNQQHQTENPNYWACVDVKGLPVGIKAVPPKAES